MIGMPAPAAIDRYLLQMQGAQQQNRRPQLLLPINGTDRRLEGRTDVRTLHRPCSACDADSVNSSTARQGSTLSFVEARPAAAGGVCGAAAAAAGLVGTLFRLPG